MSDDMTTTEIGARVIWPDENTVAIVPREQITIDDLEWIARAYLATDPEPFYSAPAFVHETRYQRMSDGSRVPVKVKVHPDRRVQALLHQMREAEMERAYAELNEEAGGHVTTTWVPDAPWSVMKAMDESSGAALPNHNASITDKRSIKRKAKAKAQRQARKRNRHH